MRRCCILWKINCFFYLHRFLIRIMAVYVPEFFYNLVVPKQMILINATGVLTFPGIKTFINWALHNYANKKLIT